MRILLVADGRSPISKNWISMLGELGHELVLVSTYPCEAPAGVKLAGIIPVGFAAMGGGQMESDKPSAIRRVVRGFRPLLLKARATLTPSILGKQQERLDHLAAEIQPDLVHALRIPFEGMLASALPGKIPLIVSIWGNDLTLHAHTSRGMGTRTKETLLRADGLMADAKRDITLAEEWGWGASKPSLVVPGSGGLDLDEIQRVTLGNADLPFEIPEGRPLVVNPRGFRPGSVHQDVFFRSIPLVLEQVPDAYFVCTAMQGQAQAEIWVRKLDIVDNVLLTPYLDQHTLWRLFARADVYVSLSSHDGTPNTFLEALACGCFPVVGDIASLQEWLKDGENGLLVDPRNVRTAAGAIATGLMEKTLQKDARKRNKKTLSQRANQQTVREQIKRFYKEIA